MYFSLEQALLQQAGDEHRSIFCKWLCSWQSSLCHCNTSVYSPGLCTCSSSVLWSQGDEKGLHEEEGMEGWRSWSRCRGLCHQEQWSVQFPPLTPPSAFIQNPCSQEGERAFYKYNYETAGINTTRQMDSSAETDRLDGEIK